MRLKRWLGGAALAATAGMLVVIVPAVHSVFLKPMFSTRWSDLTQAERDERNKAASDAEATAREDARYRAYLLAKGQDPNKDLALADGNKAKQLAIIKPQIDAIESGLKAVEADQDRHYQAMKQAAQARQAALSGQAEPAPSGNIDPAVAIASITAAFGGSSPFADGNELLHGTYPFYLGPDTFNVVLTNPQAVAAVSHPQSPFAIINGLTGLEKPLPRQCAAVWVKGRDGRTKIVFTSGFSRRTASVFIARTVSTQGEIQDTTLQPVPNFVGVYQMDDRPFSVLAIYADRVNPETQLFELQASARLDARQKFFAAY